jgi:hypothetical protein
MPVWANPKNIFVYLRNPDNSREITGISEGGLASRLSIERPGFI